MPRFFRLPQTVESLSSTRDVNSNNFHLLRFVAASLVVFSHSYPLSGNGFIDPLARFFKIMDFGFLAVALFFIISGFLVTQSAVKAPGLRFYCISRILRIWPAMIAATLFAAFLVGPLTTTLFLQDYFLNTQTYRYVFHVPFFREVSTLPGVFANNPFPDAVNGSLWTIPIECWLYLLLGCALAANLVKKAYTFNALLLFLFVLWWLRPEWIAVIMPKSSIGATPKLIAYFMLGALIYRNGKLIPVSLTLAFLISALAYVFRNTAFVSGLFFFLSLAYWAIVLALHPRLIVRCFPRKIDYSYGIYVFAFPVQQTIVALFGKGSPPMKTLTLFVSSYIVTLCLAACSWHYIESRALQLKNYLVRGVIRAPAS